MVVFASLEFMFRFLPVLLIIYYMIPDKYKEIVLLIGSIIFYASGEPIYVILLILMMLFNYFCGSFIWNKKEQNWEKVLFIKVCFALIIILNVGMLTVWKGLQISGIVTQLPLGISFYIFKMISWQVDIYTGKIQEKPIFYKAALYFAMFYQVTSGPIAKYQEGLLKNQDAVKKRTFKNLENGIQYFILGLAMKVLLADRLGILWNDIWMIGVVSISTPLAWLGILSYSMQLYFDFWGYSLMASGIGVMLGYNFIINFNHPYASKSISEFYRRWHVTLGSFFRDYIYIPLGGNRVGKRKLVLNLMFIWVLTGIWHGNGINYLLWGMVLGGLIILEKLWIGKYIKKVPLIGRVYTIVMILLTWTIFAIPDLGQLGQYFGRLFPFFAEAHETVNKKDFINYLEVYWKLIAAGAVLCIPGIFNWYEKHRKNWGVIIMLVLLFWICIYYLVSAGSNPFMYFSY